MRVSFLTLFLVVTYLPLAFANPIVTETQELGPALEVSYSDGNNSGSGHHDKTHILFGRDKLTVVGRIESIIGNFGYKLTLEEANMPIIYYICFSGKAFSNSTCHQVVQ